MEKDDHDPTWPTASRREGLLVSRLARSVGGVAGTNDPQADRPNGRSGRAVTDPVEARFAVTVAVRERRIWQWWPLFSLIYLSAAATILWFLTRSSVSLWQWPDWLLACSAGAVILVFPWLSHRRYRRSVTADHLNREVVAATES